MEDSTQQIVPPDGSSPPRGVGGWLLLFIISVTVFTPILHISIVLSEWQRYQAAPSQLLFDFIAMDWLMRAVLFVFAIYTGVQLLFSKTECTSNC